MPKNNRGSNIRDVKQQNRILLLRQITAGGTATRTDLARATGLSKMAVGNLIAEMMDQNILTEVVCSPAATPAPGRPPAAVCLSGRAPKLCGMLINRGILQVVIADLSGKILWCETAHPESGAMGAAQLVDTLTALFRRAESAVDTPLLAAGIACPGPLDTQSGRILRPADFFGIENLDIVSAVREKIHLPVFLMNDANAGALAERLYGTGRDLDNFVYLHIRNGIGAGLVLDGRLYDGDCGESGEIGHTSVRFDGPLCSCGRRGCLDLYANLDRMRLRRQELAPRYPESKLRAAQPLWADFMLAAQAFDPLASAVLDDFCEYLGYALTNLISIMDVGTVICGYDAPEGVRVIERLLEKKVVRAGGQTVRFIHSGFLGNAPLVGSAAVAAERVFRLEVPV